MRVGERSDRAIDFDVQLLKACPIEKDGSDMQVFKASPLEMLSECM